MDSKRRAARSAAFALALLLPAVAAAQPKPDDGKIDLKLFEKAEVDRSKGCSVALWQANRDPEKDKYAFIFAEALTGANNARQPARIKIGDKVLTLTRVATGGKAGGYGLYPYQLYKLAEPDAFAVLELKLGEIEGEAVEIESGTLVLSMPGRQQARVSVKGGAGCMTAAAPAPGEPVSGMFQRYQVKPAQVPRAFLATAEKKHGCSPEVMKRGITGFQMSEESAIWEVPCQTFNIQGNSVFALVYLPDPTTNTRFLTFKAPPGKKRTSEPAELMSPVWDVKSRTVTGIALGRSSGDCGVYERHRVNDEGEFALVEYREKEACDGKVLKPEQFPLVYRGK
jgi:hypothetical protein